MAAARIGEGFDFNDLGQGDQLACFLLPDRARTQRRVLS
jgi:hypothetical protein